MAGINPSAGSFVPQNGHPAIEPEAVNVIHYLESQIDGLRGAVVDELCSLRRDVDILHSGGWQVKVGPHCVDESKVIGDVEVAAIRQQIAARLNINTTSPNGSLFLDGVSDHAVAVKHDSPMKASPTSRPTVPAAKGLATSLGTQVPAAAKGLATSFAPAAKGLATSLATQLPVRTQETAPTTKEHWKPAFIRSLKPLEGLKVPPPASMKTLSRDFINVTFQGMEHSPSLFYIPQAIEKPMLPERTYYLMDSTVEPYLPAIPGQHGAKLTPFFNNSDPEGNGSVAYENVPLFIASSKYVGEGKAKANEYVYFGSYSQTRWSDKLDADRVKECVPLTVKQHWARMLADPTRPAWMTESLLKHFFPPPEYEGQLSSEHGNDTKIDSDLTEYFKELQAWKVVAKQDLAGMTKETMLAAFDAPDADQPAGLRLWWEYLECVHWDEGFYNMLVNRQAVFKNGGRHA